MHHRTRLHTAPTRQLSTLTAILMALVMLAAACGGGDSGDGAEGNDNVDSSQDASGDDSGNSDDDSSGGDKKSGSDADSSDGPGSLTSADWARAESNVITPGPGEVEFDVTLSEDTAVVSPDSVIESGGDHVYVLDASTLDATGTRLGEGSVLLIPGTALRRVTGVEESDGQLTVTTEFAALTDAFDEGDISWDVDLPTTMAFQTDPDDTPVPASDEEAAGPLTDLSAMGTTEPVGVGVTLADGTMQQVAWTVDEGADLPLKWTYSDGGLDYTFSLGVGAEHLEVQVQVTRDVGGRTALAYTARGRIETPRSSGNIQIRDGALAEAQIDQRGLQGELELTIAAAGGGKVPIDFELPGIWFRYIIPVGPIPVMVGINARVIGDVEIPAEASAQASATYTFGGDMGFVLKDGAVDASVTMPDLNVVPEPVDSAAMINNYVNAEFGVAFPHMSISLFDQGVVPRIYPGVILGTRLQWAPVCKTGYVNLVVQGSYDFKILGVNLLEGDTIDLIEPYKREARGESCGPE